MERLGVGGFATVWLYHDDELRSDVAVKALADNWAQRFDIRERFLEEARILRRADSDHVVRVYDIGEHDGTPYFVMSYADRGSLADFMEKSSPIPVPTTVELIRQAGLGLSVLHEHGVVHRDIKPQNLLLRQTGSGVAGSGGLRLLVADLGVAKAMLHASGLTQVVGTPSYMAPEQAAGIGIDTRADIHALGAVAYHMLTGKLVREGGISDLIDARLPQAPSAIADLPRSVDEVMFRALHPRPEERWPDVATFTREFARALEGQTGTAPPYSQATVTHSPPLSSPRPTPASTPSATPLSTPQPVGEGRGMPGWMLALLCLLVLATTFVASYAVTVLLEG
jgi:serine/threonine protein kinase